ncbi:hypothetical protein OS190_18745 [Sulfitobacter sp. F26204]|uniref:AAA family ATPase n=1 Tax=Sulfitobacter sp. F26204 TaxID=2996014 RepID=UPI00225E4248|nr:hypothetical protein [Sulfitobacter sp. F26204]MCX7561605.1 hypothetical protein [Sulfitobacter sp. F26204]
MTHSSSQNAATATLAAYVCTDQGAEVARAVVDLAACDQSAMHGGGLGGAARLCTGAQIAKTIITEMGNMSLDAACESVSEICQTGANVVVLGDRSDLGTYRALLNAGATEYFAFPVSPEEIMAANSRAAPRIQDPAPAVETRLGTSIGVVGCNGGVGASLLAQSLAFHASAAKGPNLRTALIDADLRFGTQAIDLDCKDTRGLQEALSTPDRIDPTFLGATMEQLNDRLALYAQQVHPSQSTEKLNVAFPHLIDALKSNFEAVVVDVPRAALLQQSDYATVFDTLVLVMPAGYAGVNVASWMITLLKSQAPNLKILPVLSEFRQDAKLSRGDIEKAIGHDMAAIIPNSEAAIRKAHRAAKPLVEMQPRSPHAKATRSLWNLAVAPVKKEEKPQQRSARAGFFQRAPA